MLKLSGRRTRVPVAGLIACVAAIGGIARAADIEVPAGTTLRIRLTKSLASFSSRKGAAVEGVIIAPVLQEGNVVIPIGTTVTGTVQDVKRIGVGLLHETARFDLDFTSLALPDGTKVAISSRMNELDNARESVDAEGRIRGIRSTGTLGYRANNFIAGLAMFDPIAYLYVNIGSARVLRFADPEIWLPSGTELAVKLLKPVTVTKTYPPAVGAIDGGEVQRAALRNLIRQLPYRTATVNTNKPSDMTNLVFLGTPGALERAFEAAGWVRADRLNTTTGFLTLRSIAENQQYHKAPMSTLLLDEQRPYFEFAKSLNTFSKRHHTRVWLRSETWGGQPVLTASSTQDIGIELSRKNKTFIHVIDTHIDGERDKIADDLIFTGCVDAAQLYNRPWLPKDAHNATGEPLITDGRVAVLKLNDCKHPEHPVEMQSRPGQGEAPGSVERGFRQGILITRNDIYRGNLIYQGYEGSKFAVQHLRHKEKQPGTKELESEVAHSIDIDTGEPSNEAPERGAPGKSPTSIAATEANAASGSEETVPFLELGAEGGWLRFGSTLAVTRIGVESNTPEIPSFNLTLQNALHNGWAVGTSVTLNSWRYFSNEFAFDYQRGRYRLGASFSGFQGQPPIPYSEETAGLLTNEFSYSLLVNLRPREKRLRPYIAAGPAFQLLHITEAPFKSTGGVFKVGLRNVGLILAAYNFANEPPLDGGGVFQFGFQYGGGIKYRVTRHWLMRLDLRETLSAQPNFVERSIHVDEPSPGDEFTITKLSDLPSGPLRQQRITLGASFVF